ncbi:right-handed parallel beta-helix repeat-containing protein [Phenylobacterium sp.]|uniref:right-handed parallel beta-helix repeat-containing protein n=1 Tax=Phenylobacterium sp. TaxID=1871053 RepID=UPI0025EF9A74|nr:right-handed parallel beta-helix repeat-containing protein [Phenylobacterium sp.]
MRSLFVLLGAIAPLLSSHCSAAANRSATPATFDSTWTAAGCGSTLTLAAEEYGPRVLTPKACADNPITLEAKGATLINWTARGVSGLTIEGGTWKNRNNGPRWTSAVAFEGSRNADGTPGTDCRRIAIHNAKVVGPFNDAPGQPYQPGDGYGVNFLRCQDLVVKDSVFTGFSNALLFGLSSRVTVDNIECGFMRSDCMDLGQVWGAKISRVYCHTTLITGKEHPDCIQVWSRYFYPGSTTPAPPSSDLEIRNNRVDGKMQGVFLGNHVRTYVDGQVHDDGGFARVLIEDNQITMSGGNAIGVSGATDITVRNNRVASLPDAPFMANINLAKNTGVVRCGNIVESGGGKRGSKDPGCDKR